MNAAASRVRAWFELVRFSHSLFALPFAAMALLLAGIVPGPDGAQPAQRWPDTATLVLLLACMVSARTAAMAYNRLADRDVDARNPRTRDRHLPRGALGVTEVAALVAVAAAVFVAGAFALNPLAGRLSLPVLAVLLGYSHAKRFTACCHLVLGLALGLAPPAVWIAVRGTIDATIAVPACLGGAVLFWVAGFDVLYACQDADFDRAMRLRSIPARFGVAKALWIARAFHAAMVVLLLATGVLADLGAWYHAGVAVTAALLVAEHRLVRASDLSRLDAAFFTMNGWISVLLCAFTAVEVLA